MSESEDSVEDEVEEELYKDVFEDNVFNFLDNKDNINELFPLGSFKHKLFLVSQYADDRVKHGHDAVTDLIEKYKEFQKELKSRNAKVNKFDRTIFPDLEQQIQSAQTDRIIQMPYFIPTYMKFTKLQPDESFHGNYNWYYTGGCLQHMHIDGNHYLLYIKGNAGNNLGILPVKNDKMWCVNTSKKEKLIKTSQPKEIFQVIVSQLSPTTLIGLRQKHMCSVYSYMKNKITECFSIPSDIPFVSFGLSPVHSELCTIDAKQRLSFWDIQIIGIPMTTYFPSDNIKYDKWHNLWYSSNPSVISLATRKSLKWMDRRTSTPNYSANIIDNFKETREDEEISIHFASKLNPYLIYVGTNLNLFVVDARSPTSAVRKWTHYLPSPPLYSSVITLGEESEIACIANHSPGNVILTFNSSSKDYPPVEFPTRVDTLLSCQASGLCLDPSIKPRMTSSLIGLTDLKSSESSNVEILTQTAALDIFSQALFESNVELPNFDELSCSHEILNACGRWNMKELHNSLSIQELKLSDRTINKGRKQEWQICKEELVEYKDVLAPIILEEWESSVVAGVERGISSDQKVSAWLDSFNFNPVPNSYESQHPSWKEG